LARTYDDLYAPVSMDEFQKLCLTKDDLALYDDIGCTRVAIALPFVPSREAHELALEFMADRLFN
jgi:hypothetical protein